jgi:sialidase-1
VNTNENQIVEISDGRLMIDARQSNPAYPARWMAISNDGGQTWSKPEQGQVCAQICASLLSYPLKGRCSDNLLLWSGIKGPKRTNLILRLSYDQGTTFPIEMLIGTGPAGYSDLTLFENGDVGILWETGKESTNEKILFTRIPRKVIMNMWQISNLNRNVN